MRVAEPDGRAGCRTTRRRGPPERGPHQIRPVRRVFGHRGRPARVPVPDDVRHQPADAASAADRLCRVRPEILDEVPRFVAARFEPGAFVVGVHYRGTDSTHKWTGAFTHYRMSRVPYEAYADEVRRVLEAASPRAYQVFVATDEIDCLEFMQRRVRRPSRLRWTTRRGCIRTSRRFISTARCRCRTIRKGSRRSSTAWCSRPPAIW